MSPLVPFEQWRVERPKGAPADVYVAHDATPKPLVLFVQGSHCLPLFMVSEGRIVSTLPPTDDIVPELARVHVAVVERRGLASGGPLPPTDAELQAQDRCTESHGGVSKVERVDDVALAVRALRRQPWVSSVFVVGHSEGADVAAGVARSMPGELRGVALLSGAGITRFFDQMVEARARGDEQAKRVFDDLIWITGPNASGDYAGASITRQITYAVDSTPLEDLARLTVPVFVAAGTKDDHVPILSGDAFVLELLRNRERQVTYTILPGLDHQYTTKDGTSHFRDVFRAVVDWAIAGASGRVVRIVRL